MKIEPVTMDELLGTTRAVALTHLQKRPFYDFRRSQLTISYLHYSESFATLRFSYEREAPEPIDGVTKLVKLAFTARIPLKPGVTGVSGLADFFIAPPCRGHGWGRELVETREAICHDLGVEKIVLDNNLNPLFWEAMGYKNNVKILR